MRNVVVFLITLLFAVTTSVGFAAGGHRGGGSGHQGSEGVRGAPFSTPRGFGEEASHDEAAAQERLFNEAAAGAWSRDNVPGKDKPSSEEW